METKGKKGSKLEIKKYCKTCQKSQPHKESSHLK
ncbi:50S ribosomal protein L33 [Candidatus Woesebacteria bacterium RIFOXYD1_FULL_46_19]|uniref:Large ribosomal subunit protein bL33 n=1 Tax=Candidatus Woesebacteria bacterium RIFOXYD1_FULL_46_19 TaxID=1802552 RepID=A0A1F8DL89_9BACT|nr:MAG: 50S ribosomal protein L33 [Candidatus Woesebacteria bacterium RIFOXYD1_FULL_46_19]